MSDYSSGWDDGFNRNPFRTNLVNNKEYRNGFCNGAYWREICRKELVEEPLPPSRPRCIQF